MSRRLWHVTTETLSTRRALAMGRLLPLLAFEAAQTVPPSTRRMACEDDRYH